MGSWFGCLWGIETSVRTRLAGLACYRATSIRSARYIGVRTPLRVTLQASMRVTKGLTFSEMLVL